MDISTIFSGDSLKAADLQGSEHNVVIASVEPREFKDQNGKVTRKLVISFQGRKKTLVCNKTNATRIAYTYGTETEGWIGKEITLYPDMVDFQGGLVEAIRVRPPTKKMAQNGKPPMQHVVTDRPGYKLSEMRPAPDPIEEATGARTKSFNHSDGSEEIPF